MFQYLHATTSMTSGRQRKNYANENGKPSDLSPSGPEISVDLELSLDDNLDLLNG